ncbi:hypothetical protein DKX38_011379 [Salix brachista]|uniref:Uncharacterized protein n=1 Tax=Salix brachista TaxID=2182728 RepID=A0A5N5M187_9ROSI|nr:hypothetical protein DKX38_011379 [Salix brachista]
MKQLIRRLSRFADSSQYSLLRSNSQSTPSTATAHRGSGGSRSAHRRVAGKTVLEGHVPVYVGDEMERFTVSAELLNHPVFIWLLNSFSLEVGLREIGEARGVLCLKLEKSRTILLHIPETRSYYIYFNSSKVFYCLSLLILALYCMFVFEESMGDTRKMAGWVCKEEARGLICLQFEESATAPAAHPRDSNASYYRDRVSISADHPSHRLLY